MSASAEQPDDPRQGHRRGDESKGADGPENDNAGFTMIRKKAMACPKMPLTSRLSTSLSAPVAVASPFPPSTSRPAFGRNPAEHWIHRDIGDPGEQRPQHEPDKSDGYRRLSGQVRTRNMIERPTHHRIAIVSVAVIVAIPAVTVAMFPHLSCSTALRAIRDARNSGSIGGRRPAQRSVTWCSEPVSQLDPRPHEHPHCRLEITSPEHASDFDDVGRTPMSP